MVTNTVIAETVEITYTYTDGRATTGPEWKSSEAVETGAFYIDASKDNSKIRANAGYVYNGMSFNPGIQTPSGKVYNLSPGEKITDGQIRDNTTVRYLFATSNVQYAYSSTEAPDDFSWDIFRPDDHKVDIGVTVFLAEPATTTSTTKGDLHGIWEFKWTAADESGEVPISANNSIIKGESTVTVTGSWTFTEDKYDVEYVFDNPMPTPTSIFPDMLVKASYGEGASVTLDETDYTSDEVEYEGKSGFWIWLGWTRALKESGSAIPITTDDSGSKITMPNEKVFVHGSWFFRDNDLTFEYTGGKNQTYYLGSDENLTGFVVERIGGDDSQTYNVFQELVVERGTFTKTLIAGTDYDYSPGSLKHDLKATFLEKLEPGTYTIYAIFSVDGSASTTFEVKKKTSPTPSKPVIPKTGIDN